MKPVSILAVDDDPSCRELLTLALRDADFEVRGAADGVEALVAIEAVVPDLVITDLRMPRMDGLDLLRHVRQRWPRVPVILLTVSQEVTAVIEAIHLGAVNYLVKPASPASILGATRQALAANVDPGVPVGVPSEIVGISAAVVEVRHLVSLAARSQVNVLITGETGTGKELVARSIHRLSLPSPGPWVAHNCAAIPPDLFESEFFGHLRGAFTGAVCDHVGLLARADGGILFLDELESLSPSHQAKLLRVMDDGEYRPVGSGEPRRASVRFFAATNRDPALLTREGSLREDLLYRLCGFEIRLPPLRNRVEDIPILARHFLGSEGVELSRQAIERLAACEWPGNARQLRNTVRLARDLADGGPIEAHHLHRELRPSGAPVPGETGPTPEERTLRHLEAEAISRALREHAGNRSHAARALGIDRSTLRRKMRDLGISTGEAGGSLRAAPGSPRRPRRAPEAERRRAEVDAPHHRSGPDCAATAPSIRCELLQRWRGMHHSVQVQ